MKFKYLLFIAALYSVDANAQLKVPADSTSINFSPDLFFRFFLDQKPEVTQTPILYPDEYVSKMQVLKPDTDMKFKMPNVIKHKAVDKPYFKDY